MSQPVEITGTKEQAAQAAVKGLDTAAKRRFDVGQPELTVVGDHFKLPAEMLARVAAQLPKPPTIETKVGNVKQRTILEVRLKDLVRLPERKRWPLRPQLTRSTPPQSDGLIAAAETSHDRNRALGRHLNWHLTFSGVEKLCDGQRRRPDKTRTEIFGIPPAELRDIEKQFENLQKVHGADYSLMATQYDSLKLAMDQMKELYAAQIREKEVEINALRKDLDHEQARLALETGRLKDQLAEQQVRSTLEKDNIQLQQETLYLKKAAAMSEQLEQLRIAIETKIGNVKQRTTLEMRLRDLVHERNALGNSDEAQNA
ncbi:hypothetical protein BDZ88DRAFT_452604 [Geranomyces variabilis]|nr:hypothetical protein BDZ88DRAFT_452604 [Geranomyces variabilis]KAJ3135109.1 hypothetical protein HDU90_004141 [Geranomyces variabilis]